MNNSTRKCDPSLFLESTKLKIKQNNPETVFCIGGGRSLLQYLPDKSILDNQNVITTNNAYSLFPNALSCHFADWVWFTWNREHLIETCLSENITCCVNNNYDHFVKFYGDFGITVFAQQNKQGLTKDPYKLCGGNTGHHIINLGYHLGFKNIVLLGYDLVEESKTHWHNQHKRATNVKNFTEVMIPGFNTLKDAKEQYGINIININRQSALKCFEFGDLEEFIK